MNTEHAFNNMVATAARVLSDRAADTCGVNRDDQWAHYSDEFLQDARAALQAAGVRELLATKHIDAPANTR